MKSKIILVLALFIIFPVLEAHSQAGKSYSIDETLKELGVNLNWDPFFSSGVLHKGDNRLKFYSGLPGEQGMVLLNGSEIYTISLPYIEKGTLRFPEALYHISTLVGNVFCCFFSPGYDL